MSNSLDPHQNRCFVDSDLDPNYLFTKVISRRQERSFNPMGPIVLYPQSATSNLQQTTISIFAAFFLKKKKKNKLGIIFHENPLLADNHHDISYLIFSIIGKDVAKF